MTSAQPRNKKFPLWAVPCLIALAAGTVWVRLTIVRTSYAINETEKKLRQLRQEREQAEFKVAGLRSPRHLETLAKNKFGLTQPKSEQVVHLK